MLLPMFQSRTIAFLFLFLVIPSHQEEYNDICFIILDDKEKDVNIKFNKKLMFIPNFLTFDISTTENLYDKKLATIKRNIYRLAKANHSCSDPFVYEVPWSSQMILIVNMLIYWGEIPVIVIDKNEMVVRPEFEPSNHEWGGLLNRISLDIYLKHEKLNRNYLQQTSYSTTNIDWNGKVRELLPGESYCLRLFTINFLGILIFAQTPVERGGIFEYYRLKVTVFSKNGDIFLPTELEYISNVFPCYQNLALKNRIKIFIKPQYYKIQFKLIENYEKPSHIAEYVYHRGRFKLNAKNSNLSFIYFEIKPAIFSIDMFKNKSRMLIYTHTDITMACKARIPETIDNLHVSRIAFQNIDNISVQIHYYKVDMSTNEVGVYKIIRDSESENFELL